MRIIGRARKSSKDEPIPRHTRLLIFLAPFVQLGSKSEHLDI